VRVRRGPARRRGGRPRRSEGRPAGAADPAARTVLCLRVPTADRDRPASTPTGGSRPETSAAWWTAASRCSGERTTVIISGGENVPAAAVAARLREHPGGGRRRGHRPCRIPSGARRSSRSPSPVDPRTASRRSRSCVTARPRDPPTGVRATAPRRGRGAAPRRRWARCPARRSASSPATRAATEDGPRPSGAAAQPAELGDHDRFRRRLWRSAGGFDRDADRERAGEVTGHDPGHVAAIVDVEQPGRGRTGVVDQPQLVGVLVRGGVHPRGDEHGLAAGRPRPPPARGSPRALRPRPAGRRAQPGRRSAAVEAVSTSSSRELRLATTAPSPSTAMTTTAAAGTAMLVVQRPPPVRRTAGGRRSVPASACVVGPGWFLAHLVDLGEDRGLQPRRRGFLGGGAEPGGGGLELGDLLRAGLAGGEVLPRRTGARPRQRVRGVGAGQGVDVRAHAVTPSASRSG
jgi:hypothetical protein